MCPAERMHVCVPLSAGPPSIRSAGWMPSKRACVRWSKCIGTASSRCMCCNRRATYSARDIRSAVPCTEEVGPCTRGRARLWRSPSASLSPAPHNRAVAVGGLHPAGARSPSAALLAPEPYLMSAPEEPRLWSLCAYGYRVPFRYLESHMDCGSDVYNGLELCHEVKTQR